MITQENEFLKTYNEIDSLWEDTDTALESTKVPVEIKGCIYEIETPFMTIPEFLNKRYYQSGIYVWKRLPDAELSKPAAYYVGLAKNLHYRNRRHRLAQHNDSPALHAALRKYRTSDADTQHDRFRIAILEFCENDDTVLNNKEVDWIKTLGTFEDKNDYNLTQGGGGVRGVEGKNQKVTIEMFEEIVKHLQANQLATPAIGALYGLTKTTILGINKSEYQYVEKYTKELNLNVTFPIRPTDVAKAVGNTARSAAITNKQKDKYWNLKLIQYDWADETHTKVVQVSTETIEGPYTGKDAVWAKICELERSRFKTENTEAQIKREEEKPSRLRSLVQAGSVSFDLLRVGHVPNDTRYKRKYVVTRAEAPVSTEGRQLNK